jgi:hypothetical protein
MSKSGEQYKSKKQEMKHERGESKRERKMEYGSAKGGIKMSDHSSKRKGC